MSNVPNYFEPELVGSTARAILAERGETMTYVRLTEQLFREKYTGPVTLHFAQGQPVRAEIPSAPTRIRLDRKAD